MFNITTLPESDQEILAAFFEKRAHFNDDLKQHQLPLYTCPGCGYPTITERGDYEICKVCNWEDDGYDDDRKSIFDAFLVENKISGPNGRLTLIENRIIIGRILQQHAHTFNGTINHDTLQVLSIIDAFNKRQEQIEAKMTGDELGEEPIWKEWKQVRIDLQAALILQKNAADPAN